MWQQGALVLLCCLCATAGARVSGAAKQQQVQEDVLVLNSDDFPREIERLESPALVQFLIPDCKTCNDMAGEYRKVARNLKGIAPVAAVDCTNVMSVRTCRAYGAHSFPKLLLYKPGTHVNPYTGGALKNTIEYKGKYSAREMAAAVTNLLDDTHITQLTSQGQHGKFIQQQPKLAKVLLFTDKNATTVLYKGLSWAYAKRLSFAELHAAEGAQLVEQYGIDKYPTLLIIRPDGTHEPYSGPLKAEPLHEVLDTYVSDAAASDTEAAAAAGEAESLLEPVPHSLVADNLTEIDSKHDMWLVGFYSAQGWPTWHPKPFRVAGRP